MCNAMVPSSSYVYIVIYTTNEGKKYIKYHIWTLHGDEPIMVYKLFFGGIFSW